MLAVVATLSGAALGTISTISITPACTVPQPRTVSSTLIKIGQKLCEQWMGLANITRTAEEIYTFECAKYALFTGLEVTMKALQDCTTDLECETKHGPM